MSGLVPYVLALLFLVAALLAVSYTAVSFALGLIGVLLLVWAHTRALTRPPSSN